MKLRGKKVTSQNLRQQICDLHEREVKIVRLLLKLLTILQLRIVAILDLKMATKLQLRMNAMLKLKMTTLVKVEPSTLVKQKVEDPRQLSVWKLIHLDSSYVQQTFIIGDGITDVKYVNTEIAILKDIYSSMQYLDSTFK